VIAAGLVAVLLLAFVAVPAVFAETSEAGAYRDITVNEAYKMIKKAHKNLVILDVRNQSEYDLGHLYDAVLIPVYELENRINELQEHVNDPIIVYCKAGSRSQIACEILATNGFTKVYNMLGGITAWIQAGYPIYTTYHYVTADAIEKHVLTRIEPLLAHQGNCSCDCSSCTLNTSVSIVSSTTVRQENVVKSTYTLIVNGTEIEITTVAREIANETLVNKYENKTLLFTYTQVSNSLGFGTSYYTLIYAVETSCYYFGTETFLAPAQNSSGYDYSFTHITFATKNAKNIQTMEFVKFNSSTTLSRLYNALSGVAKELRKLYHSQGLEDVVDNYHEIEKNLNELSEAIKKQLRQYDTIISESTAIINDARITACIFPWVSVAGIGYYFVFYCLAPNAPSWVIQGACCAALYAVVLGAAAACIFTAMVACLLAIVAGAAGIWAALSGCWGCCPSMQVCITAIVWWWSWDIVCTNVW
jgi:rhodanese-related sulfurtransferase